MIIQLYHKGDICLLFERGADLYNSEVISYDMTEGLHLVVVNKILSETITFLNPIDKPILYGDRRGNNNIKWFLFDTN